jgi:hypothetical protein
MGNNLPKRTHLRPAMRTVSKMRIVLVTSGIFILLSIGVFVYVQFTGYEYAEANTSDAPAMVLNQPNREVLKAIPENSFMEGHSVMLAYFTAYINPITVELRWSTAAEDENDYFIVERSQNGAMFSEVGTVESKGTLKKSSDYSFIDNAPGPGSLIYRLRQVSKNGNSSLIAIEKTSRNNPNKDKPLYIEEVSPKNFDKFININYFSNREGGVSVEIFDNTGKNIYKAYTEAKLGYNTCRFINGEMLTQNEYTLRIANAGAAYVRKIKREFNPGRPVSDALSVL